MRNNHLFMDVFNMILQNPGWNIIDSWMCFLSVVPLQTAWPSHDLNGSSSIPRLSRTVKVQMWKTQEECRSFSFVFRTCFPMFFFDILVGTVYFWYPCPQHLPYLVSPDLLAFPKNVQATPKSILLVICLSYPHHIPPLCPPKN